MIYSVEKVDDHDAWRADIRRQARADRIKVRTGVTGGVIWALLAGPLPEAQREEDERYFHLFHRLQSQAELRGHALKVALRDGEEVLFGCERCDAVGYADAASGPLIGGPLFEKNCSG